MFCESLFLLVYFLLNYTLEIYIIHRVAGELNINDYEKKILFKVIMSINDVDRKNNE